MRSSGAGWPGRSARRRPPGSSSSMGEASSPTTPRAALLPRHRRGPGRRGQPQGQRFPGDHQGGTGSHRPGQTLILVLTSGRSSRRDPVGSGHDLVGDPSPGCNQKDSTRGHSDGLFNTLIILVSLFLICLILIQRGKGGGLAGAFGGVGGSSAFGTKAGDTFTKITVVTAVVWILMAMLLVVLTSRRSSSGWGSDDAGLALEGPSSSKGKAKTTGHRDRGPGPAVRLAGTGRGPRASGAAPALPNTATFPTPGTDPRSPEEATPAYTGPTRRSPRPTHRRFAGEAVARAVFAASPGHEVSLLLSMTGFGDARLQDQRWSIQVEVRTVNNRHLKLSARSASPTRRSRRSSSTWSARRSGAGPSR